nr:HAMP domain-containing sensor histidine kinase [uncultured Prevotella sp.]
MFKVQNKISLLSKTLKQFAICAAICFILTAPAFYLLTKYYYAEDMIDIIKAVSRGEGVPPIDLEQDIVAGMMIQYLLIFCVFTIAMFITMRFVTKKVWEPFDDTLRKAEQFNLAQNNIPLFADTDIEEFNRLNLSLERLMKRDRETYRIQKEFTENASHELQTPLAIIRSKLDLLMQGKLGEKELKLVSDLYQLTMRIGHLNRNLLLLAKIENAQYTTLQEVDVAEMLSESLPLYEALQNGTTLKLVDENDANTKDIGYSYHHHLKVQANPVLLECLLKNLIVNAIRHSPSKGEIQLIVGNHQLIVSNDSIDRKNGKPLDSKTLFQRFRSGDNQQSSPNTPSIEAPRQKGNGLGLAIVKAICDFHHWSIEYHFEDGKHQFIVHFPSC